MTEYIEREAIKYELWAVGPLNGPLMVVRKKTIDNIPAADVVPVVHGRWIKKVESKHDTYTDEYWEEEYCSCPLCGKDSDLEHNYCPNCGARMDGE